MQQRSPDSRSSSGTPGCTGEPDDPELVGASLEPTDRLAEEHTEGTQQPTDLVLQLHPDLHQGVARGEHTGNGRPSGRQAQPGSRSDWKVGCSGVVRSFPDPAGAPPAGLGGPPVVATQAP